MSPSYLGWRFEAVTSGVQVSFHNVRRSSIECLHSNFTGSFRPSSSLKFRTFISLFTISFHFILCFPSCSLSFCWIPPRYVSSIFCPPLYPLHPLLLSCWIPSDLSSAESQLSIALLLDVSKQTTRFLNQHVTSICAIEKSVVHFAKIVVWNRVTVLTT